jgi:hypothetical protein
VPEYCTCGAKLPEDALFCHKCGKPQREDLIVAEPPPPPPPVLPPPVPAAKFPPIGFHNGPAVRIALVYGFLSIVTLVVLTATLGPAAPFLLPVWLVAAGFLAVLAYRRRTGQRLSWLHGAHLGWICGIFGFAIVAAITTAVMVALSDPTFLAAVREQVKMSPQQEKQMIDMLHSGPSGILTALLGTFLWFTILPAFGGALGAKLLDRD